jgi:hypothetical protein
VWADGFTQEYFYRNKFSACRSEVWRFPIETTPTHRLIAVVTFELTFVSRGYNGDRSLDIQVEIDDFRVDVSDRTLWQIIGPALSYKFSPHCERAGVAALPGPCWSESTPNEA